MKRIERYRSGRRRGGSTGEGGDLFAVRTTMRPMVIMVDAELIDAPASGVDDRGRAQQLLGDLLEHENLVVHRYSDAGPPAGTASISAGFGLYPGWATVTQAGERHWDVVHGSAEQMSLSGVIGNAVDVGEGDTTTTAYSDLGAADAAARRLADTLAAQVASQALEVDVFITERSYLHEATWRVAGDTTVCDVDDALALIGLYQRSQGQYLIVPRYRFNRGLFTWVATRELLPSAWRWYSATRRYGTHTGDEKLTLLAGSLLQRVQRALVGRDDILVALNQPQNNDVRDDALTALDDVCYRLMGALDVLARVAHRVCALTGKERSAGWQSTSWLDQLAVQAPDLADLMRPDKPGAHVLTVVRLLRNTIHGEALQGLHVEGSGKPARSLLALNSDDEAEILAAMDALGDRPRWGVETLLPGRVHVDPGVLIEELFAEVIPLLNELMDHTPVQTLEGVTLPPEDLVAPADRQSPFSEPNRFSIRKQYGL